MNFRGRGGYRGSESRGGYRGGRGGGPRYYDNKYQIVVNNLTLETTEDDIINMFKNNEIHPQRIKISKKEEQKESDHKQQSCYAFVSFSDQSQLDLAIKQMYGKQLNGNFLTFTIPKSNQGGNQNGQQEKEDNAKLIVTNLPIDITEKEVFAIFKSCGFVTSCKIYPDKKDPNRQIAFVQYKAQEDAQKAIKALDSQIIKEQQIKVKKQQEKVQETKNGIYIKNLPTSISKKILEETFSQFGEITYINIHKSFDQSQVNFTNAVIDFKEEDSAIKALDQINHKEINQEGSIIGLYPHLSKEALQRIYGHKNSSNDYAILLIKNIPSHVTYKDVKAILKQIDAYSLAINFKFKTMINDQNETYVSSKSAHVLFKDFQMAQKVYEKLDQTSSFGTKVLKIEYLKSKAQRKKDEIQKSKHQKQEETKEEEKVEKDLDTKEEAKEYEKVKNQKSKTQDGKEDYLQILKNSTYFRKSITIVMVGETGAGKTTLLNALNDYVKGNNFDRRTIQKRENTAGKSQTQTITKYTIAGKRHLLNIIDTPGLADTEGVQQDVKHLKEIQNFIEEGEFNAICIVIDGGNARAKASMQYVIKELQTMLPKDCLNNIVICATRTSKSAPSKDFMAVLEVLDLHERTIITFANSAYEELVEGLTKQERKEIVQSYYHAQSKFEQLLDQVRNMTQYKRDTAVKIKESQKQLKEETDLILLKLEEICKCQQFLKKFKQNLEQQYASKSYQQDYIATTISRTKYVTSPHTRVKCQCQSTCHEKCSIQEQSLQNCFVFKNGSCQVCGCQPNQHFKCKYDQQGNQDYIIGNQSYTNMSSLINNPQEWKQLLDQIDKKYQFIGQEAIALQEDIALKYQALSQLAIKGFNDSYVNFLEEGKKAIFRDSNLDDDSKKTKLNALEKIIDVYQKVSQAIKLNQ